MAKGNGGIVNSTLQEISLFETIFAVAWDFPSIINSHVTVASQIYYWCVRSLVMDIHWSNAGYEG